MVRIVNVALYCFSIHQLKITIPSYYSVAIVLVKLSRISDRTMGGSIVSIFKVMVGIIENCVGVRSSKAERCHRGATQSLCRPWGDLGGYLILFSPTHDCIKKAIYLDIQEFGINIWVQAFKIGVWRDDSFLKNHDGFNDTGQSTSSF